MASSFGKAFAREMGKNTGKWASNIIFGDSWSTPYRRTSGKGRNSTGETARIQAQASAESAMIRAQASAEAKIERARIEAESRAEIERTKNLYSLDAAVISNIDKLSEIPIPTNTSQLLELLGILTIQMKTIKYEKYGDEADVRNKYLKALIEKYRQCVFELKCVNPNDPHIDRYEEILDKRELEVFVQEEFPRSGFASGSSHKVYAIRIPDRETSVVELMNVLTPRINEAKYDRTTKENSQINRYFWALIIVFGKGIDKLTALNPRNSNISEYIKLFAKKKSKYECCAFICKYSILSKIVAGIFVLSFLYIPIANIFDSMKLFIPILGAILFIAYTIYIIYKLVNIRKGNKELLAKYQEKQKVAISSIVEQKPTVNQKNTQEIIHDSSMTSFEDSNKQTEFEEDSIDIQKNVFFDLNEDNRIGGRLAEIWRKYGASVSSDIINRRPIFSADGVRNSILFVGVNPSFDPKDDERFLENEDKKSLLYGSFYQREDAPIYFKGLEMFAAELGKGYTHMNLLYARENDRNKLLKSNSEFIREQLELSYDTIVKINPCAIIFFTTFCKDLIFGANRWVDPKSLDKNSISFILNGTNIPVFFTEDLTTLDEDALDNLMERVKVLNI